MNGELLKLVLEAAPELATALEKFHRPKNEEVIALLLAETLKENRRHFESEERLLNTVLTIVKQNREGIESLVRQG